MRRRLKLIFPYYTDTGGFKKESIKNLKNQPVLIEFFNQLRNELNDYIIDPEPKKIDHINNILHDSTLNQTKVFIKKGYYSPDTMVYGKTLTNQVSKIIELIAEKKKYAEKEKCVHPVDEMVSKPITLKKRNKLMAKNMVIEIKQLFNNNSQEFYVFMDRLHVKEITDKMLDDLIYKNFKLKLKKRSKDFEWPRILNYSN